jgi:uncharacterized membrane protein YvlD (DUF360 family)
MVEKSPTGISYDDELRSWKKIGIVAGFLACLVYPIMILVSLPRVPQVVLGASFGPALAVASVALAHILQARRRTPSLQLAGIFNCLAGALVTAMIIVQLAINYSTAPAADEQLNALLRHRIWDVVLGLDVSFDVFIGLGTLLFAVNMIGDPRFGRTIGWAGAFVALVALLGANIYFFPDPPYVHGFPHVGIFTGLWYLAVTFLMVRSLRKGESVLLGRVGEERS